MDREEALALFFTEEDAGTTSDDDLDHVDYEETSDEDLDDDLLDIRLPSRKKTAPNIPINTSNDINDPTFLNDHIVLNIGPQTINPDNIVDFFKGITYDALFYTPNNDWYCVLNLSILIFLIYNVVYF